MEFMISLRHGPPKNEVLRRRYYDAVLMHSRLPLHGVQLADALNTLSKLDYKFVSPLNDRVGPSEFRASISLSYTPEDWAMCELFEPEFHLLADNQVEVRYPLPPNGSAKVLLESMDFDRPEFVLAGAVGFAFVREPVKLEMEGEHFAGMEFSRAGVLGFKRGTDEIESGEGKMMMSAPQTGEKLWQIRSSVVLPTPVSVPEEQRTHRPLADRTDVPEEMRKLAVVENRLVFMKSSLDALGLFDIGFLPQPPHPHGNALRVSPPRVVVSRRLKDWLTRRLSPVWKAEGARQKATNAAVQWTEAMHDRWRPVTIIEA